MRIVLRTHGGLGNQIFQTFYGRLLADKLGAELTRVHDARYAHGFGASSELGLQHPRSRGAGAALSWLRIPKLLKRAGVDCETIRLPGLVLLDGYFQQPSDYAQFESAAIARELRALRAELGIGAAPAAGTLVHVRLGDFFTSEEAQKTHLAERMESIPDGAAVITNRDDLLVVVPGDWGRAPQIRFVPTADLTPEALLRLMSGFGEIRTNESTLAFWASILGNCRVTLKTSYLAETHALLVAADQIG